MISAIDFSLFYKNNQVLNDINFEIKDNEFVLILGDNGSGKTTLLKCINGLIPNYIKGRTEGYIKLDNIDVNQIPLSEISKKVGTLLQNFQHQLFSNVVKDEMTLMLKNFGVSIETIEQKVNEVAISMDIVNLMNKRISSLSYGQMQKIAIASILTSSPDILLFDEPTSNIDQNSIINLVNILSQLKAKGKTIIVVDHNWEIFLPIIDKIFLINKGHLQAIDQFTLKKLSYAEKYKINMDQKINISSLDNVLECRDVCYSYNNNTILKNINFIIRKSKCIGITGDNGAGKTTFGKILAKFLPIKKGVVNWKFKKVILVSQNPDTQLFFDSVEREIDFNSSSIKHTTTILQELDFYNIKNQHPHTLSQGQKQLLVIGSALTCNPDIIILDEPTASIDNYHKTLLASFLIKHQKKGLSIIILSHDMFFLKRVCNKIMKLEGGYIYEI
ncbi:MAG: ABC transporter ATP-binding protein [Minisyncoccia bacterium]